jgi:hypothetical protein
VYGPPTLHSPATTARCLRRDLARAARACREFAAYVREQRRSLHTVTVPDGVSHPAVR